MKKKFQVLDSAVKSSQIGKSTSKSSIQNQISLKKAMEEAQKLSNKSTLPPVSLAVKLPETTASTILYVLHDTVDETDDKSEMVQETSKKIINVTTDSKEKVRIEYRYVSHSKVIKYLISKKI